MEFSADDRKLLEAHVTNMDSDIYAIHNLPPEVIAVLFAYVSRSPASFRENLLKLIKSKELDIEALAGTFSEKGIDYGEAKRKAKEFHERWVVGYGHSSIAEHAVASIAIENVSILATKVIEDNRLASYTEKSTRYQIFDRNRYYKPKAIMESKNAELYESTCNALFDFYSENIENAIAFMKNQFPKPDGMPQPLYESISKARACDAMRYALPASTLTNLGMTVNARNLEHAIRKLRSHPLEEMNDIGEQMKHEATKLIPTLIKYADRNEYISGTNAAMDEMIPKLLPHPAHEDSRPVTLVEYDYDAENRLVAAILYRYSQRPYAEIRKLTASMNTQEKERVTDEFLKRMGKHDQPMRELEHIYYTFDILCDYGAFRDIQRHRMCTQTSQELTALHGHSTPKEMDDLGLAKQYESLMDQAKEAYREIAKDLPKEAQYVVPLAFRKRTLFTWNLRALSHFIRLRSGKEGHESYRKIAREMYEEIRRVHPLLAKYITVDMTEGPAR
jgi:thymidylate synthase ThyX